ncbi:EAL domain-containing protein [Curvibacter sp. APW13]|uniref:EAL domain-containing protein n=1 Tax=Curvibacter sp. APW13 TaxID=3077236 RepID=UPI0028DFDE6B|nr:EAL domain-containing protein [Curvibacter sp. APW13]MDT8991297.1 EAL domain-containing protein [Curvibacter sp. APW13]
MKQPLHTWPLRRNLLLALGSILALALVLDRLYEFVLVRPQAIEAQYIHELRQRSYNLSRDYSQLLLARQMQELRFNVAARATDRLQRQMVVFDAQGRILASSGLAGTVQQASEVERIDLEALREAQAGNLTVLRTNRSLHTVSSYSPLSLPGNAGELRSLERGVLFMELDLGPLLAESWRSIYSMETVLRWGGTLAIAMVLMGWFVHHQIIRPLRHLQDVGQRFAQGDWQQRSALTGTGELAELGRVLNAMQNHILQDREQLQNSAQHFRSMIDHLPLSVQIFAPDGTAVQVNEAWMAMWQARFEDLRGYRVFDDVQLRQSGVLDKLRLAFAGQAVELPLMEYDKSRIPGLQASGKLWLRAWAYPLLGARGQVERVIAVQEDITTSVQAEERIRTLAYFDPLTELPNRRMLLDRLSQAMAASERSGTYGALLFMDLDHFKVINDTRGHEVGDKLLRAVAQRLLDNTRGEDTVARLGGDEFVVLLGELGTQETDAARTAEAVASKLLQALGTDYQIDDLSHHSSVSVGVSLFHGTATSADDLMKHADMAMYRAKSAGRAAVRFFSPELELAVRSRAAMEAELRTAIAAEQFVLHYQPQVQQPGPLLGAEALVRWQHPVRGLVPPSEFIALLEESELIIPLGWWVLEQACERLAAWAHDPVLAPLTLSVNVSARQFMQPDFAGRVMSALRRQGVDAQRLKIELTESTLVQDMEEVVEKMRQLGDEGIGFSLDDFGTGYSSLSYLKRLPLSQLKIDHSFVRDILDDPNDAAIASTVIALGRTLGLDVIAEGVETPAQLASLASMGCYRYQGYLFSKAVPADAFESWSRARAQGAATDAVSPRGA